ncbi:MAG: NAD(P)H-hydrate dehydratase, partial [Planctomycetota bacterium]
MKRVRRVPRLPPRPVDAHKGDLGRLFVVAGSREMLGAAALCARAALRAGVGLVRVALPPALA